MERKQINQEALKNTLQLIDNMESAWIEAARNEGALDPRIEQRNALLRDEAFCQKLITVKTLEEAQTLFAENGVELTTEEIKALLQVIAKAAKMICDNDGELPEEMLDEVSGGGWSWGGFLAAIGIGAGSGAGVVAAAGAGMGSFAFGVGAAPGAAIGAAVGAVFGGLFGAGSYIYEELF